MDAGGLVFASDAGDALELVVNFGVFAGRDATPAEIERLAEALLAELDSVEIVSEHRYEFARHSEASVHQVKVRVPWSAGADRDALAATVEAWARDCIAERRLV